MKTCPFCAESIQDAAIVCRFCGRDTPAPPPPEEPTFTPQTPAQQRRALLRAGLILVLFVTGAMLALPYLREMEARRDYNALHTRGFARMTTTAAPSGEPRAVLDLLAAGARHSSRSHMTVEGQVKNVSAQSLRRVAVVLTWYGQNRSFITSETVLIEYDPILPGQTSPFQVISTRNPEMQNFAIEFRQLGGGVLAHADHRYGR